MLLDWPYRRFIAAFEAWQRRKTIERIDRQEDLHVAATYSNTNMDMEENHRGQHIEQLRSYYSALRRSVMGQDVAEDEVPDEHRDAFLRASRRNQAIISPPQLPGEAQIARLPG